MCCDLLRINYLCGRITNKTSKGIKIVLVVICSELTTFAVESPTGCAATMQTCRCDLLRINYLCGRITNYLQTHGRQIPVVICSELTTFAVESPTKRNRGNTCTRCDLLRINYLCGRITNKSMVVLLSKSVVICSELTTFAVESPTYRMWHQSVASL